jgi:hypothetical protein
MMKKGMVVFLASIALSTAGLTFSVTASARQGNGAGGGSEPVENLAPLSPDEIHDLYFMREEEKLARDSYWLLGDEWGLTIYDNISKSEQQHMDAIKNLLDRYQLEDPVEDEYLPGGFVDPKLQELFAFLMDWGHQSLMDGLYVGAAIEETDIIDIQHAIERADHADIIATYESLVCGSRNHLRAFVGQIELRGDIYTPLILPEAELEVIINTPMERDCGGVVAKRTGGRG